MLQQSEVVCAIRRRSPIMYYNVDDIRGDAYNQAYMFFNNEDNNACSHIWDDGMLCRSLKLSNGIAHTTTPDMPTLRDFS